MALPFGGTCFCRRPPASPIDRVSLPKAMATFMPQFGQLPKTAKLVVLAAMSAG
jgi:hypothetical protein